MLDVAFTTHDGLEMYGKLTLPDSGTPRAVVVYVQTAEGMTVDTRRPDGRGGTFDYFDLYRTELPVLVVGQSAIWTHGKGVAGDGRLPFRHPTVDA